jgi:polar amino acid transport system substrate-binding protein
MRWAIVILVGLVGGLPGLARAAESLLAPAGTLRAVHLAGNPVQAVRDPRTGAVSGIAVDLARELSRRIDAGLELFPGEGIQAVIEAVRDDRAEIGFLATDPSRRGAIEFSQTYLRNPQSLAVLEGSPIRDFADIDRNGLHIGATRADSIALYLDRTLKAATLVEVEGTAAADIGRLLQGRVIDAFGASRLRLVRLAAAVPGLRILPGRLFGVPQAIIVRADRPDRLEAVNRFLDAVRQEGFLQAAIDRADTGAEIEPAPR